MYPYAVNFRYMCQEDLILGTDSALFINPHSNDSYFAHMFFRFCLWKLFFSISFTMRNAVIFSAVISFLFYVVEEPGYILSATAIFYCGRVLCNLVRISIIQQLPPCSKSKQSRITLHNLELQVLFIALRAHYVRI